ncbi:MAG: hypothetical protein ACRELC_07495 [Gemmatimonadota bacterium]
MRNPTARACGIAISLALASGSIAAPAASRTPTAQNAATREDTVTQEKAMEPLAWLVGDWEGEGWIQRGPEGARMTFTQTEHVERVFEGRLLLVEGVGRARSSIVRHAYGVLSWDPDEGAYAFDTYLADEAGVDAAATVEDGVLTWSFDVEGGRIRFRTRETGSGEWHENGEFSPDGTTWYPFFEMTLRRVAEAGS